MWLQENCDGSADEPDEAAPKRSERTGTVIEDSVTALDELNPPVGERRKAAEKPETFLNT